MTTSTPGQGSIVITGACGAYGRELATAFSKTNNNLVLLDRMPAYAFAHELAPGCSVDYITCDLADPIALDAACTRILEHGSIRALINNAGIFPFNELMEVSASDIAQVFAINVIAPTLLCQRIGAAMMQSGGGAICNISSASASVVRSNGAIYGSSKAALEQLTRAFAVSLADGGIRVNAIRPGLRTENLVAQLVQGHQDRILSGIPMGRLSEPGEVAALVEFLCSDDARFITGQVIAVDGGSSIHRRAPTPQEQA
jgi:NAD(P)-dependent dehydrogenase (short-subunit alcohol dehydrogenase family)